MRPITGGTRFLPGAPGPPSKMLLSRAVAPYGGCEGFEEHPAASGEPGNLDLVPLGMPLHADHPDVGRAFGGLDEAVVTRSCRMKPGRERRRRYCLMMPGIDKQRPCPENLSQARPRFNDDCMAL